jgi:hypothetical protein
MKIYSLREARPKEKTVQLVRQLLPVVGDGEERCGLPIGGVIGRSGSASREIIRQIDSSNGANHYS